jgi:transcription elongation factor Elf1
MNGIQFQCPACGRQIYVREMVMGSDGVPRLQAPCRDCREVFKYDVPELIAALEQSALATVH